MSSTSIPATLVWFLNDQPQELQGTYTGTHEQGGLFQPNSLPNGAGDGPADARLVLCLEDEARSKLLADCVRNADGSYAVSFRREQPILRRYYPRADAALALGYRAIELGAEAEGFSQNQIRALKAWWKPSSSVVNISNDGISFVSTVRMPMGSRLQLRLRFPDGTTEYALAGKVVRSVPEAGPEGEEYHRLAVHFDHMSRDAKDAIDRYMKLWLDEAIDGLQPNAH